jgi:EAL domain-containing protein (putative c-di-GMP-specific phosphodiesterase class I)
MEQSLTPSPSSVEDLARAIDREQLALHYQPIVNLVDETVVGFEALVRWPHERRGLLGAAAFVPLAEASGLVHALDDWVLMTACRQLAAWQEDVLIGPGFRMAINVSGAEVTGDALVERVNHALDVTGADPRGLTVEVTETWVIASIDAARRSFDGLHALGVELALDDFGSQHATFARLHSLPFDVLKIDRDFVVDSGTSIGKGFLRTIVELGDLLGSRLVAEGIESAAQAATLRGLGCHEGQGFRWAPGVPAEEAERILDGSRSAATLLGQCPKPSSISV